MSTLRQLSVREVDKILRENGYTKKRQRGDHRIYKDSNGNIIPITPKCNKMVIRREFKEKNIIY